MLSFVLLAMTSCAAVEAPEDSVPSTAEKVALCGPGTNGFTFEGHPVRIYRPIAGPGDLPAVVVLHGSEDNGASVRRQTQFDRLADQRGFVTVYPTEPDGNWDLTARGASVLNRLTKTLPCVDQKRVYLTGFSRGSAMALNVACAPGRRAYAAFGGVALADYRHRCDPSKPAAIVYFHGTADTTVSYSHRHKLPGGRMTPPPLAAMHRWAAHNHCASTTPRIRRIGDDVVLRAWHRCRARAAVDFYSITGGDHQWPFAARPNAPRLLPGQSWAAVGAAEVMWEFFSSRSL